MPEKPNVIDFFEYMRSYIGVNKIEVNNCILLNYQCWETGSDKVWFKENHLVFILSGDKTWELNGDKFSATKGDIVFVRQGSGIIHHSNSEEFCALILFIPKEYVAKYVIGSEIKYKSVSSNVGIGPIVNIRTNMALEGYRNSLLSYLTDSSIDLQKLAKIKLEELLHYIFNQEELSVVSQFLCSLVQEVNYHVQYIMDNNYMAPLTLSEYASMCNMSLSAFKRKFSEIYEESPGTWLRNKRISLSEKLLATTSDPIAEIAEQCGFNSTSYFVKSFTYKNNITPLQYRKAMVL